ncbi:uncharacterized protein ACRADG_012210 [Cochliomyia hominivorax]
MSLFKLKFKIYTLCTMFLFILLQMVHPITTTDEISKHISTCCEAGKALAKKQNSCENYEYDILSISPLWRGLCHSTYAVCCSHEMEKMFCIAGRLAALIGSRCNEQYNTTSYSECCRACQVGLAVKASGNSCNDTLFNYFADIESFRICCGETSESKDNEHKTSNGLKTNTTEVLDETSVDSSDSDGTIILKDYDDDICGKFPLCEQICENTKESYVCKCHPGFKLNDNMVTCTPIDDNEDPIKKLDTLKSNMNINLTKHEDKDDIDEDDIEYKLDELDDISKETTCPEGFKSDPQKPSECLDINECLLNLHDCKSQQKCVNTDGGFRCVNVNSNKCEFGYTYNKESEKCEEVKKQSIKQPSTMKCEDGFLWKNGECVDINECETDDTACDSNQVCVNDIGGYHCDCKIGFNLDTTTNACFDINECSINNHNCLPTQRCDNTIGSYVCTRLQSCGTGYTLNADSNTCDDNDECALNTHNCKEGWECYNTKGSFRCYPKPTTTTTTTTTTTITTTTTTSKPTILSTYNSYYPPPYYKYRNGSYYSGYNGYASHQTSSRQLYESSSLPSYNNRIYIPCETGLQRNSLGVCVDINECLLPTNPCGSHQRCINTNGSYRCQNRLKCPAGYKSNPKGTECIDIDECETGEHNCVDNQICRNRNGGFVCSCPPGHKLTHLHNGESRCIDINECDQRGLSLCPANAQCINTIGSYFCECKSGFQKSKENDRICLDVDECNEIPGLCHQKCVNFFGGYRCTCNNGYELAPDNRTCVDVDECEVQQTHKLCMGFCDNVPGSYECSCPRGYTLANDRTTCLDIDECATGEFCTGRNDVCTNKRGGYKCTTINCPFGYTNDPEQKTRCRLTNNMCEGEDCFNKPSSYTYNFITFVSKMMVPPEGRTFFSLKGPAWYDDIEFDMKIVKIQAAANIEKATNNHFGTTKGHHEVHLSLKRSLDGPQEIEIDLTMTVFTRGLPRGKSVAKVFIIVSQYSF